MAEKERPGDETEAGTKQAAENICPRCSGSGEVGGKSCEECDGTGRVTVIVGDA